MRIHIVILSVFLICVSCIESPQQKESISKNELESNTVKIPETVTLTKKTFDSIASKLNFEPGTNYAFTKQKIENHRKKLSQEYKEAQSIEEKEIILDSASQYFTRSLLNKIIPYWYGTEWDFNGHTNTPNQGEIACGYFVSTTLKHMGLKLNRYKMAQQASKLEVETIAIQKNNILFFQEHNISEKLKTLQEGLCIVGLDNHVGYIYVYNNKSYFIHSSYVTDRVMIELTSDSEAFYGNLYYMASITKNRALAKKWLQGETVAIRT